MCGWDYKTGDTINHSSFAAERTLITGFAVKTMRFFLKVSTTTTKQGYLTKSVVFEANPELCVLRRPMHDYICCLLTRLTHLITVQVAVAREMKAF